MLQEDYLGFECSEDPHPTLDDFSGLVFDQDYDPYSNMPALGHMLWNQHEVLGDSIDDSLFFSSSTVKSEIPDDFNLDLHHVEANIDAFGGLFSNTTSDISAAPSPHSNIFDDDDEDDEDEDDDDEPAPSKGKPVKRKSSSDEPSAKRGKRTVSKPRASRLNSSASTPVGATDEAKRRVHNMSERNRRGNMKSLYQALRDSIPELAGNERPSNRTILSKAVDCIHEVQRVAHELDVSIPMLREENRRLTAVAASYAARAGAPVASESA